MTHEQLALFEPQALSRSQCRPAYVPMLDRKRERPLLPQHCELLACFLSAMST